MRKVWIKVLNLLLLLFCVNRLQLLLPLLALLSPLVLLLLILLLPPPPPTTTGSDATFATSKLAGVA